MRKKSIKRFTALIIAMAFIFSFGIVVSASGFLDMPDESDWAYEALTAAVENSLLVGDNNCLMPEAPLKRNEMATIINRAFGASEGADISAFADVPSSAWYYGEMAKAVQMGAFKGDNTGTIRPEAQITRQEAFVVLARVLKLSNGDISVIDSFPDSALVADWAKGPIAALVSAGYVHGSDGKLNPAATITRQEFAQLMFNTVKQYISTAGEVTSVSEGNIMINVPDVTLKDLTITGDLIIGDGVGNGDVTLDNVKVLGRMVVRGGGANSVVLENGASVEIVVLGKTASGALRLQIQSGSEVKTVEIGGTNGSQITLGGEIGTVSLASDAKLVITGTIASITISEEAEGTSIEVAAGASVGYINTKADDVTIDGTGKVTEVVVSGDNTKVNTVGAEVTTEKGTEGVTANGTNVDDETTIIVPGNSDSGDSDDTTYYTVTIRIQDDNPATDDSALVVTNTALVTSGDKFISTIGGIVSSNYSLLADTYRSAPCSSEMRTIILDGLDALDSQSEWDTFVAAHESSFAIAAGYTTTVDFPAKMRNISAHVSAGTYVCTFVLTPDSGTAITYTVTITIT